MYFMFIINISSCIKAAYLRRKNDNMEIRLNNVDCTLNWNDIYLFEEKDLLKMTKLFVVPLIIQSVPGRFVSIDILSILLERKN